MKQALINARILDPATGLMRMSIVTVDRTITTTPVD